MRTLRGLSRSAGRIYLYAGSAEAKALLCRALCAEGFTLGGEAPSPASETSKTLHVPSERRGPRQMPS